MTDIHRQLCITPLDGDSNLGISVDDDDTTLAGYVHGGVYFKLGESPFQLGVDVRTVFGAEVELFGVEQCDPMANDALCFKVFDAPPAGRV